eukprot:5407768-Pleurochrysis_carterae.AAC.2
MPYIRNVFSRFVLLYTERCPAGAALSQPSPPAATSACAASAFLRLDAENCCYNRASYPKLLIQTLALHLSSADSAADLPAHPRSPARSLLEANFGALRASLRKPCVCDSTRSPRDLGTLRSSWTTALRLPRRRLPRLRSNRSPSQVESPTWQYTLRVLCMRVYAHSCTFARVRMPTRAHEHAFRHARTRLHATTTFPAELENGLLARGKWRRRERRARLNVERRARGAHCSCPPQGFPRPPPTPPKLTAPCSLSLLAVLLVYSQARCHRSRRTARSASTGSTRTRYRKLH